MLVLTLRHLRLFFKNPYSIILSLASSLIILSLYFLFIKDFMIVAIHDMQILDPHINQFVDELMISGLLIVINATSMLSILSTFINDKSKNIIKDFLITPVSKRKVYYSYILACILCGMFITIIVFMFTHIFLAYFYSTSYSLQYCLSILYILFLSSLISSHILFLISYFISNISAFSSVSNLFGVLIGFFTGVYIPISYYPQIIKDATFLFPLSQTTSLIRQFSCDHTLIELSKTYPPQVKDMLSNTFGVSLEWNNVFVSQSDQFILLYISLLCLLIITYLVCGKK